MSSENSKLDPAWAKILEEEYQKDYFKALKAFLVEEKKEHSVFPSGNQIFNAFQMTPYSDLSVVLIGQDPYHGIGQAHGLSFSVPEGIKPPPSLVNIFKEIHSDLGLPIPKHGNLEKWAKQGVLLLNATLTVRANAAGSHQNQGWEIFTDTIISKISDDLTGIVFLLWGKFAQAKEALIDADKHYILKAAHPSPFSAHNGFFGCKHFSMVNMILKQQGKMEIDWTL